MHEKVISYALTYQVLQDSIVEEPLIIPMKYKEDEEGGTIRVIPD
jgi:hypothetical protein